MKTHWQHLGNYVPSLASKTILDLGCGKGTFLIDAARHGATAVGLEPHQAYIDEAYVRAKGAGVSIRVEQGVGETLPFKNGEFDFVNMCEVIEHVESPRDTLREVYRVLKNGGHAYVSIPNRFGFRDQHFHLYFVNWLPRNLADTFISIFGTHKHYEQTGNGRQRLADMHYATFAQSLRVFSDAGFDAGDIRERRIKTFSPPQRFFAKIAYPLARAIYFDSFHFLLTKHLD